MRSPAIIHPGPAWSDGRPVFDQDPTVLREHLGHLRRLFALGAQEPAIELADEPDQEPVLA